MIATHRDDVSDIKRDVTTIGPSRWGVSKPVTGVSHCEFWAPWEPSAFSPGDSGRITAGDWASGILSMVS